MPSTTTRFFFDGFRIMPVVLLLLSGCSDATNRLLPASKESEAGSIQYQRPPDTIDQLLDRAYAGIGGRDSLQSLDGFSITASRDRYELGMGLEPGVGIVRAITSELDVVHDLTRDSLRIDYLHTNLYRMPRRISELIIGQTGYISGRDFYYEKTEEAERRTVAMGSGRWAMTKKTEALLNPHLLLKKLLAGSSSASLAADISNPVSIRLTDEQVFPVTLYLDEIMGQRTLVTNEKWERRWRRKRFLEHSSGGKYITDNNWNLRWNMAGLPDDVAHYRLVVEDDVYPITLYIEQATGRISKLATMEYDMYYGDVTLELTYHNWQSYDGVYFPTYITMFVAGAPTLEVSRSRIQVNPSIDSAMFEVREGIDYQYDEELVARGARLSQWVLGVSHAGSPKPVGRPLSIEVTDIAPGVLTLHAIPDDALRMLVVEQENRIIVADPGYLDVKGEAFIAWIKDRFPGKPITHVIATHFHVDHVGGIRPYMAEGATVVTHQAAYNYYESLFLRPESKILPDAFDLNPQPVNILEVQENTPRRLDDAEQPVVVYPIDNRHTTDMLMVVLEKSGIVYNGDLYSPGEDIPDRTPQAAVDLDKAMEAYAIRNVQLMVGAHGHPVTYEEYKAHLAIDGDLSAM